MIGFADVSALPAEIPALNRNRDQRASARTRPVPLALSSCTKRSVPCLLASGPAERIWIAAAVAALVRRIAGAFRAATRADRRCHAGAVLGFAARSRPRRGVRGRRQRRHAGLQADRRTDVPHGRAAELRDGESGLRAELAQEGRAHRRAVRHRAERRTATARSPSAWCSSACSASRSTASRTGRIPALESKTPRGRQGIVHGHVRRRRRRGRSEGGSEGDRRLPARAGPFLRHRRPHSERRAARRPSGHRQDAARAVDRRRGEGAVPLRERLRFRRDVRRRRRVAHPQAVQGCAASSVVHHLHRRARRRRPQPRRQLAQPRGARADAQPAARRDGRLRAQRRASSSSRRPIVRTFSIRRCCGPAGSIDR